MHELAVCQALISQVRDIALERGATGVSGIRVALGPLSGVEPALLQSAYTLARAGTLASDAALTIVVPPLRVRCRQCGAESQARPNRLLCPACGSHDTRILSGDEMILESLSLTFSGAVSHV